MKDFMKIYTKIINNQIKYNLTVEDMFIESGKNKILFELPDTFYLNKHGLIQ